MTSRNLLLTMLLAALSAVLGMAQAQSADDSSTTAGTGSDTISESGTDTNTSSGAGAGHAQRLSFLSAQDRQHFLRVRRQVLTSNPDLKTEQESLMKEAQFVKGKGTSATSDDRQTLKNNFLAHREKMNAAMVQADATVQPILDQINAHMKARFQQAGGGGTDNP